MNQPVSEVTDPTIDVDPVTTCMVGTETPRFDAPGDWAGHGSASSSVASFTTRMIGRVLVPRAQGENFRADPTASRALVVGRSR